MDFQAWLSLPPYFFWAFIFIKESGKADRLYSNMKPGFKLAVKLKELLSRA
jgi:hypothetical protein